MATTPGACCTLTFEEQALLVCCAPQPEKAQSAEPLRLNAGRATVAALLRHQPPSALELERAIETVEDAVMPARRRLPPGPLQLACNDALLRTLARHALPPGQALPAALSLAQVEALFARLAALAQGRPAAHDALPTDAPHAATLIILRELMHHWALPQVLLRG